MKAPRTRFTLSDDEFRMVTIPLWEQSFDICFEQDDFAHLQTVGDVLSIIQDRIYRRKALEEERACSTHRMFDRLRQGLLEQGVLRESITPASRLADLFPLRHRRQRWTQWQKQTNLPLPSLRMSYGGFFLLWLIATGSLWGIAPGWGFMVLTGFSVALALSNLEVAQRSFPEKTLGSLTRRLISNHYVASNEVKSNWQEVRSIVLTGLAECSAEEGEVQPTELDEETVLVW